jgi:hypothetical protein
MFILFLVFSEIFIHCRAASPLVRILSVKVTVFIFKTLQNKTSALFKLSYDLLE